MKAPYLLQLVGLPALVLAGLGVGAAAAKYGATDSEIPSELLNALHCRFADVPTQVQSPEAIKAYEDAEPPLWGDLGTLSYPITTKSKEAQSYFDQGLKMATNFNHAEARRALRKAQGSAAQRNGGSPAPRRLLRFRWASAQPVFGPEAAECLPGQAALAASHTKATVR